jgi:hypothetical protein
MLSRAPASFLQAQSALPPSTFVWRCRSAEKAGNRWRLCQLPGRTFAKQTVWLCLQSHFSLTRLLFFLIRPSFNLHLFRRNHRWGCALCFLHSTPGTFALGANIFRYFT